MKTIHIAHDFSKYPGTRFKHEGFNSAEEFLEKHLLPILSSPQILIILDGTNGYASSFLDEIFGGIIRKGLLTPKEAISKFKFISREEPELITEILDYIQNSHLT